MGAEPHTLGRGVLGLYGSNQSNALVQGWSRHCQPPSAAMRQNLFCAPSGAASTRGRDGFGPSAQPPGSLHCLCKETVPRAGPVPCHLVLVAGVLVGVTGVTQPPAVGFGSGCAAACVPEGCQVPSVCPSTCSSTSKDPGAGDRPAMSFPSQPRPISLSVCCWYEGSWAGVCKKGSGDSSGWPEAEPPAHKHPCGDTTVPEPSPPRTPAETWPHSLSLQSIQSRNLVYLGPLPIGAEQ